VPCQELPTPFVYIFPLREQHYLSLNFVVLLPHDAYDSYPSGEILPSKSFAKSFSEISEVVFLAARAM
jgi:hypothetical protein